MEVILKEDIRGLGYQNDIVSVKPGYGRNFLIPKGMALLANEGNVKVHEENLRQKAKKLQEEKNKAEKLAEKIGDLSLDLKAKVGEKGKIFGAITALQVSDALKEKGFEIDRKKISFDEDIKFIGEYFAELDFHKEVKQKIKLLVIPEEEK
jgi:large subunit ribosomal protein L9